MDTPPRDDKSKELKLHFTISEIKAIDEFRATWMPDRSRNKLFHIAIEGLAKPCPTAARPGPKKKR